MTLKKWRGKIQKTKTEYSPYDNYDNDLLFEGEGKLDASGHLQVDFDVPPGNENDLWDFQYRLEAEVTDSSRRTIYSSAYLIATRGNVIADANPERFVYVKGRPPGSLFQPSITKAIQSHPK